MSLRRTVPDARCAPWDRGRYDPRDPAEAKEVEITFSDLAGGEFYKQVQDAIDDGDEEPFFDFTKMPGDWQVPAEHVKV